MFVAFMIAVTADPVSSVVYAPCTEPRIPPRVRAIKSPTSPTKSVALPARSSLCPFSSSTIFLKLIPAFYLQIGRSYCALGRILTCDPRILEEVRADSVGWFLQVSERAYLGQILSSYIA